MSDTKNKFDSANWADLLTEGESIAVELDGDDPTTLRLTKSNKGVIVLGAIPLARWEEINAAITAAIKTIQGDRDAFHDHLREMRDTKGRMATARYYRNLHNPLLNAKAAVEFIESL